MLGDAALHIGEGVFPVAHEFWVYDVFPGLVGLWRLMFHIFYWSCCFWHILFFLFIVLVVTNVVYFSVPCKYQL